MNIRNWIFVTGTPRSATTYVGLTLSSSLRTDYIHEPFNPACGIPGIETRFLYLRPGVTAPDSFREPIDRLFQYRVRLRTGYYPEDGLAKRMVKKVVGSRGPFYYRLARLNPIHNAVVIKDPVGCLLTGYLAERHGVRPVILIRHPVAVAASIKRLGWGPNLDFLLNQQDLLADHFTPESLELVDLSTPVRAAAWEWWALNTVLLSQTEKHPEWIVLLHEDLCTHPVPIFRRLHEELGLPWSVRVEKKIRRRSSSANPAEARRGRTQDFYRDSRGLFDLRLGMLTAQERRDVFDITREVALKFYSEESFHLQA